VPGYYRMALGDFEVTALYDGDIDLDRKLLSGASAQDIQRLLARMFIMNSQVQITVNAYLVHTESRLVLVDTGAAKAFGPTMGVLLNNIRAARYDPAQIDAVLLTHLHPDHASGLLTPEGKVAFPNAEVRVAKAKSDYWLDEAVAAKAPKDTQPFFKINSVRREPRKLATVDLERLRARLAGVIERTKEEDPRELHRRIAELEHPCVASAAAPAARGTLGRQGLYRPACSD